MYILVITLLQLKLKTGSEGDRKNPSLSIFDTSQQGEKFFPGKSGWIITFFCCHEIQMFAELNPSVVFLGRWPGGYSLIHRLLCFDVITLSEI